MNNRNGLQILSAVICLLLAAFLQVTIPVTESWQVKFFFLTAVAIRMQMTRPVDEAIVCTLWAGMLTDALSGLTLFCTSMYLLLVYGAIRAFQRFVPSRGWLYGILFSAVASFGQIVWMKIWLGAEQPLGGMQLLIRCGQAIPAGIVAGVVGFSLSGLFDRLSGRIRPVEEDHGVIWTETDR
ncbi:MAG: hypothetical protein IKR48_01275 [Kiritimatiellae bacterium]|nr:hypothetical protein [Kiritimatiellia bacterium]